MVEAPLLTSTLGRNVQHHTPASLPLGTRLPALFDKRILVLPEIKSDSSAHSLVTPDEQRRLISWTGKVQNRAGREHVILTIANHPVTFRVNPPVRDMVHFASVKWRDPMDDGQRLIPHTQHVSETHSVARE